ncbi:M81 family metallopeptidase [Mesorhizobium sp. STM 4661]|uniref:M81 family metallopeptidase n=1 Tax=Mesorhizobium sp. STM 4661 TaxID=1297570 RepID=UPI0002BD9998|nr:M81 family metallopeptidase [Mesorhizobium sp. STM 4661]CCV10422.1 Microcystin LR degradation protein MlrC-like protein [Mesorhizobium sp. STM 4661]
MRVFTASLATETNTFSPVSTDRSSFEMAFYAPPGKHPETPTLCSAPIPVLRRRAKAEGFTLIEGTATWAEPGGYVRLDVYEALRDEILDQLRAAMPVDCVVLGLHGAMIARGLDDCEGDLLARVREIVGPKMIVAAELDPHSHLTKKRVAAADILAAFLEFPHTDFVERAEHVVELALAATRGKIRPVISSFDCRMIDVFPTSREPMRSFVDRIKALQGKDGILSVSLIHGFLAGDTAETGTQLLVVSDNDRAAGNALAERLGQEVFAMRGSTAMRSVTVGEAIERVRTGGHGDKPFVLADMWDNPGGGTAGDNTALLHALVDSGIRSAGVATIWDPQAVARATGAGEGTMLDIRIGGKTSVASGMPFDGTFEVRRLAPDAWQSFGSSLVPLGPSAVLRLAGTEIDIVINTNRTQTFEPDIFSNLGIDPHGKQVLIIKSTNHFHAGFVPVAREIIYVAVEGCYPNNPVTTPYRKLKRPIWPIVADPFGPDRSGEAAA